MSETVYEVRDVQQTYGGRTVLRIPHLEVRQGEVLSVLGPSGAGKSTLLRLLALLEAPARGQVRFHTGARWVTHDTAAVDDRRQITMVFQRPVLLSRSVQANVRYGLRVRGERDAHARVEAVLRRVSLDRLAQAHVRTLSGGEAQRVALARALVLEPRVLLLDEPTANLDPANVGLIETLIREQHAQSGTTIVLVTHSIFQARRLATRVALLIDGELVEVAPAPRFFDAPQDARTEAFLSGEFVF
ncbi:MAG TPA: phosphate ABC transporter ATP-binding protein [Chloroflexi bacterium]|nr:phosphate ABC transporter ATP-binding protein [Chloroflexota bacterium]